MKSVTNVLFISRYMDLHISIGSHTQVGGFSHIFRWCLTHITHITHRSVVSHERIDEINILQATMEGMKNSVCSLRGVGGAGVEEGRGPH